MIASYGHRLKLTTWLATANSVKLGHDPDGSGGSHPPQLVSLFDESETVFRPPERAVPAESIAVLPAVLSNEPGVPVSSTFTGQGGAEHPPLAGLVPDPPAPVVPAAGVVVVVVLVVVLVLLGLLVVVLVVVLLVPLVLVVLVVLVPGFAAGPGLVLVLLLVLVLGGVMPGAGKQVGTPLITPKTPGQGAPGPAFGSEGGGSLQALPVEDVE